MRLILMLASIMITFQLNGQSLTFQFGTSYFAQKASAKLNPEIRSKRFTNSTENSYKINYDHFINDKVFLSGSFSRFPLSTYINVFGGNNSSYGEGWTGINVNRFDLSVKHNVLSQSKFIIQPYAGIGLQMSRRNVYRFGAAFFGGYISTGDPNILIQDAGAEAFEISQIVPSVGLKFGYTFWNRMELFFDAQGVFGHKIVQEIRMNYSYKGIMQPQAVNYSDGSGRFYAVGLGYRFIKLKKK
jgi:hypothetical protein